jgi:hypothetical protein
MFHPIHPHWDNDLVQVDWAIIGLGRSGTTSLAAWLDSHPRLRLIRDESDNFREGAFDYLYRGQMSWKITGVLWLDI